MKLLFAFCGPGKYQLCGGARNLIVQYALPGLERYIIGYILNVCSPSLYSETYATTKLGNVRQIFNAKK